jgi:hypothetical protein
VCCAMENTRVYCRVRRHTLFLLQAGMIRSVSSTVSRGTPSGVAGELVASARIRVRGVSMEAPWRSRGELA